MNERLFIDHLIQSFSKIAMTNSASSSTRNEQITAKARDLWQKAGSPPGRDLEFWLAAEHELGRESRDIAETKQGIANKPPRSTPGGRDVKQDMHAMPDESETKATRRTRRVTSPVK